MRCKLIRELILTDYIDGKLDPRSHADIDKHLRSCMACRELKSAVTAGVTGPFRTIPKEDAPPYLWERIKAKIVASNEARAVTGSFFAEITTKAFSAISRISRPAIAFAVTAAIITAIIITRSPVGITSLDAYLNDQADFIAKLDICETNGSDIFDTEIKTGVENLL